MKACIRRGSNQIGGSAVEIIADNQQRLIIDIGLPLDAEENTADFSGGARSDWERRRLFGVERGAKTGLG